MKIYKFKINGSLVECVTIKGLADMAKRKPISIRKLIQSGVLPEANFCGTPVVWTKGEKAGETVKGQRYYTMALADMVAAYIKSNFVSGRTITEKQKLHLKKLFEKEKQLLNI